MLKKMPITFASSINQQPGNYVAPSSKIERSIVTRILSFCLPKEVNASIAGIGIVSGKKEKSEYDIEPPRLLPMLKILIDPEFQLGETYVRGQWYLSKGDLSSLLNDIFSAPRSSYLRYFQIATKLFSFAFFARQYLWGKKATRKSAEHYNIESGVYELILDKEFLYTCAFFEGQNISLEQAQLNKMDTILQRLELSKGAKHFLDIGCGWGSLLRRSVKLNPKLHATGISIAKEQVAHAKELDTMRAGDSEIRRIEYLLEDYVDHRPEHNGYDAISVVGMMEHVGIKDHSAFVNSIEKLLKPEGKALIHTIVCPKSWRANNRWVDKHIFPGGYAPSISEVTTAIEHSPLKIEAFYVHAGENYKRTMECWRERFLASYGEIGERISMHCSTSFEVERELRIWYFYLSSLQNMFDENLLNYKVGHFVLSKKRWS